MKMPEASYLRALKLIPRRLGLLPCCPHPVLLGCSSTTSRTHGPADCNFAKDHRFEGVEMLSLCSTASREPWKSDEPMHLTID